MMMLVAASDIHDHIDCIMGHFWYIVIMPLFMVTIICIIFTASSTILLSCIIFTCIILTYIIWTWCIILTRIIFSYIIYHFYLYHLYMMYQFDSYQLLDMYHFHMLLIYWHIWISLLLVIYDDDIISIESYIESGWWFLDAYLLGMMVLIYCSWWVFSNSLKL